jgi:hypothetical protein
MTDVTLREYVDRAGFPAGSAPEQLARQLADLVPDWRIELPDADSVDLWMAAQAPDGRGSFAITAGRTAPDGYRDIDEWAVDCHGDVWARITLYHADGQEEFAAVLRVLRVLGALPADEPEDAPAVPAAGQERSTG